MGEWIGQETADITYHDRQGTLTDLLIDKGYLTPEVWRDRRPFYFIEVKSTTGPCNTPFFMSKAQVKRVSSPLHLFLVYCGAHADGSSIDERPLQRSKRVGESRCDLSDRQSF